ncbi:Fc.00g096130.m01.CDS01 [Cosmosporella sp. VM-42]
MAQSKNSDIPVTNDGLGEPLSSENQVLTAGAAVTQDFRPVKKICAHLNAFHAYAHEPRRSVETNHYCSHLNNDVRQCLLYDSDEPHARLIGIEYMITPHLFETLPPEERKYWHSHVYEVKSGMLIMPNRSVPNAAWEVAENWEMDQVVHLYGKAYHLWQTDRGDTLPLGEPQLMTSYTADGQFDFEKKVGERDQRFGVDWKRKKEVRADIATPEISHDADQAWKKG